MQEPETEDSAALVPVELLLLAARVVATQEAELHMLDAAMSQTAADTGYVKDLNTPSSKPTLCHAGLSQTVDDDVNEGCPQNYEPQLSTAIY